MIPNARLRIEDRGQIGERHRVALGRPNGGTFSEKQIHHIQTYKECVGGW